MKTYILLIYVLFSSSLYAQDGKTVTLVVSGQGKTQEEARQNALRSAIEQAFGTFISSKTEIIGDSLLKDEIVSISNGNIQKFDVINETLLPNNMYVSTLNATVSIAKLTTFCQSKGIKSEFKGGLFAMNIAMQELNESNEKIGFNNLYKIFTDILPNCLDYKIIPNDPVNVNNKWKVQLYINFVLNKNYDALTNHIIQFVKSISMSEVEVNSYKSLNKPVYPLKIHRDKSFEGISQSQLLVDTFYLRNKYTYDALISFPYTVFKFIISNVRYNNSIETHDLFSYMKKYAKRFDCLVILDSKMQFYRYLDNYSEYSKKYMMDKTTSMFQNSGIGNGGHLTIDEGSPKSICTKNESYDTRVDKNRNYYYVFNGKLFTKLTSDYWNEISSYSFENDTDSKTIVPGTPIFNLHGYGNKEFLKISLSDYFNLEEIKNITEYKVELFQNK